MTKSGKELSIFLLTVDGTHKRTGTRVAISLNSEPARQRAHALAKTPAFAIAQRARRKVEALFAELKNYIGLRRLRLRRMRFVREQFYLAATVQNLKRLVRFLNSKPAEEMATA